MLTKHTRIFMFAEVPNLYNVRFLIALVRWCCGSIVSLHALTVSPCSRHPRNLAHDGLDLAFAIVETYLAWYLREFELFFDDAWRKRHNFRFFFPEISFNFTRRLKDFLPLYILGQTLSVPGSISSFLLLLIMGQIFSVPRSISVNAAEEEIFEDVALEHDDLMPYGLAFAEPEMNAHQEAPLGHVSETNVDAAPEIPLAQSRVTGLQYIPTELLLEIANSLPPSSIIFLTRTCRRIHHDMNVSFERLLGGIQQDDHQRVVIYSNSEGASSGPGIALPFVSR